MADLVLGIATSHTPLLCLTADEWEARARNDRHNPNLHDVHGDIRSYDELLAAAGDRFGAACSAANWNAQAAAAQRHLDELAERLERVRPDVAIVVGDDQLELFSRANLPALAIYCGERVVTHPFPPNDDPDFAWLRIAAAGYAMDEVREFPACAAFATELIEALVDRGFDVGAAGSVPDPLRAGFGHAYGFVLTRLMARCTIPIVPLLLNTYYPPNQPRPARCYDLGVALRAAIEASPAPLRVAVIASGGLSHFVTNEALDTAVLDALRSDDRSGLRALPAKLLNDGSSEIRNWIVVGGALGDLKTATLDYLPVYRTPAGTGIGLGFAAWS